jgi:hypothetical protein
MNTLMTINLSILILNFQIRAHVMTGKHVQSEVDVLQIDMALDAICLKKTVQTRTETLSVALARL